MCENYIEAINDIISTSRNQSLGILKKELLLRHTNKSLEDKIQEFLLKAERGFAFVARQKKVKTETGDFYLDLTQRQSSRKILCFE